MLTVLGRAKLPPVYFAMLPALAGVTLLSACGDGGADVQVSQIASGICGGGGCAGTINGGLSSVPTTLAPSEKTIVEVTYNNTGTVTWDSNIALRSSPARLFGTRLTQVSGTVAPGNTYTFRFVITSPASLGPALFDYQLYDLATGQFFGDAFQQSITIQNQTPNYSCILNMDDVPTTMVPGGSYTVSYEIENNGLQGWPNPNFYLCQTDGDLWQGTRCMFLPSTVPIGGRVTVSETITAPMATGSFTLSRQVFDYSPDVRLGAISSSNCFDIGITVAAGTAPVDAAEDVGSRVIPGSLSPGELSTVTVVMTNTGTNQWETDGSFALIPQDNTFGAPRLTVQSITTTGNTESFVFPIQAPGVAGTYNFEVQMNELGGAGAFGEFVSFPITVSGSTPVLDAAEEVASRDVPSTMSPGETRPVTIVMRNTGTQTWTAGNSFNLAQTDNRLFGNGSPTLSANTAQNALATFSFNITAPGTPGSYNLRRRMNNAGGAGQFGTEVVIPITVNAGTTPLYDATVVSQVYPPRFTPGETLQAAITMRNSGTGTWTGSAFALTSQNTPTNLWTRTTQSLGSCDPTPPGADCTFNVNLAAPTVIGTYDSLWRMSQAGGVGLFGATASQTDIPVTYCGNGVIDSFTTPPEVCDYGDAVDGDGCSSTCQIEVQQINLASDSVGRTFRGSSGNRQLGTVTSGNIDNDASTELLVGENGSFMRGTLKNGAGRVAVYEAAALDSTTTTLPTSATLQVYGAEAGDALATLSTGNIVVADVTGDGNQDLITSAPKADGANNGRVDSGEVYVILGGSSLTATAGVDLEAPGSFLGAKFEGAVAGDNLTILAAGDLTGDGVADLVLGASLANSTAGEVIIIQGGSSLANGTTFDLSTASVYATISGAGSGDQLGNVAVVGDVVGSTDLDLVLGANNHDAAGRSNAGVVYVFAGPVSSGAVAVASARDLEIRGSEASVRLGQSIAVGDVTGTTRSDLVIGAPQTRFGGTQIGSVEVFEGPITIPGGGVIDMLSTSADTQIQGVDGGDRTGNAVAVGNYDGNAFLDIAVGASLAGGPGNAAFRAGEVTIVLGDSALPSTIDLSAVQSGQPPLWVYGAVEDRIGSFTSALHFHDIDADGIDDLCIGTIRAFTTDDGAVHCVESQFD